VGTEKRGSFEFMNNILVVAVHPDDETLGCGGTLLKHRSHRDDLFWLIATSMTKESGYRKSQIIQRQNEIDAVAKQYGFKKVFQPHLPTTRVDEVPMSKLVPRLAEIISAVNPHTVYLPFKHDIHSDHRRIFEACSSSLKSFRMPNVKKILMMEVISETDNSAGDDAFSPNYFVDISAHLEQKISIMKIFKDELKAHPFPRSVENIRAFAMMRGAAIARPFAEAFMLLKEIQ